MKKSLLFSALMAAVSPVFAGSHTLQRADVSAFEFGLTAQESKQVVKHTPATRASENLEFTYSNEIYSLTKLNGATGGVTRVYLLFQVSPDDIKGLAGDKVTGFTVYSSSDENMRRNSITEGRFFYSFDLSKEEYSQDFTMSKTPFDANNITIDTPYTITGEEESLFFGYSFVVPKADDMYYIPFDGIPNPYLGAGVYSASNTDEFPAEFYSFAADLGALCMSLTLEGDNFPNYVKFMSVPNEIYLPLGEKSSAAVTLTATCPDPIESIDFEYVLGGKEYTSRYELSPALAPGASLIFSAEVEFPAQTEFLAEDVTVNVVKYNDKANVCDGSSAVIPVTVLSKVPVRQTLMEEYTSTSCPWCTRGFAALEYIKKNYPEFVTASFHTRYSSPDPMQITTSFPSNVSGYPSAVLNRAEQVDPFYGTQKYMDMQVPIVGDILALNKVATPWMINVSHEWASEDELVAKAEVANMLGYENMNFSIAYLLIADGLSGTTSSWRQSNNYASYSQEPSYPEELNAFCRGGIYGKSQISGLVFNDVVISPDGIHGEKGSVPATLAAEEVATHSLSFDLSKISSSLNIDKKKLRVVAAVLDANGNVLNCAKNEVNDEYDPTAVEGIENADNAPVEYFNLSGIKIAQPAQGIFVRRQGVKTEKVIIK